MKVEVYKNIRKKKWSVRDSKTGKLINHTSFIHLKDAKLVVQPGGRARVLRDRVKNVHAFIKGEMTTPSECLCNRIPMEIHQIKYDPYKNESFIITTTEEPIYYADHVMLLSNGLA